ncbi:hypothetical protein [uncultured Sunxiuqinia sp.]|uniref:hypothetical protein n=1 Tax=uncultured Sunxiuqinia sp. TaxID=1573825 RepID=UPI0026116A20|nr:hypothetical protein [uncultured Sunxiuqinia sp.]
MKQPISNQPVEFETGHIYHVFNRGNNSQRLFFTRDNYLFFIEKIRTYILPHADLLAWCLMPTHFHLMVHVNEIRMPVKSEDYAPFSSLPARASLEVKPSLSKKSRSLNDSIGIMLRSYSRAIQKQENRTGSLFQKATKARCLTQTDGISPAWFQSRYGAIISRAFAEDDYPQVCFDYIHANPVKDALVGNMEEWAFSSARDYAGLRNGKLINKERAGEFGLVYR